MSNKTSNKEKARYLFSSGLFNAYEACSGSSTWARTRDLRINSPNPDTAKREYTPNDTTNKCHFQLKRKAKPPGRTIGVLLPVTLPQLNFLELQAVGVLRNRWALAD